MVIITDRPIKAIIINNNLASVAQFKCYDGVILRTPSAPVNEIIDFAIQREIRIAEFVSGVECLWTRLFDYVDKIKTDEILPSAPLNKQICDFSDIQFLGKIHPKSTFTCPDTGIDRVAITGEITDSYMNRYYDRLVMAGFYYQTSDFEGIEARSISIKAISAEIGVILQSPKLEKLKIVTMFDAIIPNTVECVNLQYYEYTVRDVRKSIPQLDEIINRRRFARTKAIVE